jgi:hypothetical protein
VTYTNSGGGFAAMTGGMGILRAMHDSGALAQVSYMGANSGGNWLLTQMLWSESFYGSITSTKPIEQVITEFGATYSAAMTAGGVKQALKASLRDRVFDANNMVTSRLTVGFARYIDRVFTTCPRGEDFIDHNLDLLINLAGMPAKDWASWVEVMMTDAIPDVAGAKYDLERKGLPGDITYVQQVALPPDVWLKDPSDWKAKMILNFTDPAETAKWKANPTMALPIAHYSTKDEHGWLYHAGINRFKVRADPAHANVRFQRWAVVDLPADPKIVDITASSSAAGGFIASPTLLQAQSWFPDRLSNFWAGCFDKVFRDLAVPQPDMVDVDQYLGIAGRLDFSPRYRFIDGGFVDNTALASTIGKVAADNPEQTYLGKFIHFDIDETFGENRVEALFTLPSRPRVGRNWNSGCNTQGEYCLNSNARGQHNANNIGRPSSLIFAETVPDHATEYTAYADWSWVEAPNWPTSMATKAAGFFKTSTSYYFTKRLTTVENKFYKVPAGKTLDLLVFSLNIPKPDVIIAAGNVLDDLWETVYGPIAKAQAEGATPVIKAFIES